MASDAVSPPNADPAEPQGIAFALRAFRSKNYRLFYGGQFVSLVGTFLTQAAMLWLVYLLTHHLQNSALYIGLTGFCGQVPLFLLGPFAGVWVDRVDKRKLLVATQVLSMVQSLALAAMMHFHFESIFAVISLATFQGVINAFDLPCRQAFLVDLVSDRRDLSNAIALNSTMVHMARIIGPTLAGFLMAAGGAEICFFVDGISYIAVIFALLAMVLLPFPPKAGRKKVLVELREGLSYVWHFVPMRELLFLTSIISLTAIPAYSTLAPIYAHMLAGGSPAPPAALAGPGATAHAVAAMKAPGAADEDSAGGRMLGFIMGSSGVGALVGAILLAARRSVIGLGKVIAYGGVLLGSALIAFSFSRTLWLSLPLVAVSGYGMITTFAAANTLMQTLVDDDMRGRVMSFFTLSFIGMTPFGSLLVGGITSRLGSDVNAATKTMCVAGGLGVIASLLFMSRLRAVRELVRPVYIRKGILPEMAVGIQAASEVAPTPEAGSWSASANRGAWLKPSSFSRIRGFPLAEHELESALRDLSRHGTLVKDRPYRQVWRFEFEGRPYYLKFYPRTGLRERWRRRLRGSSAMREFTRLQWLQKAKIPAPRAVAALMGFRLDGRIGDAVVLQAIEPSQTLDMHLNALALDGKLGGLFAAEGEAEARRGLRGIARQVVEIVRALGAAKLGHGDLHLGNFLLSEGKVHLLDAAAVRPGGLRVRDVLMLAHSAKPYATRTDLLRGWRRLHGDAALPRANPVARRLLQKFLSRIFAEDRYFGRISMNSWRGSFFRQCKLPARDASASRLHISREDWSAALGQLMADMESGAMEPLKRSPSGDVFATVISLAGENVEVVLKHPRTRRLMRRLTRIGRGSRSRHAWGKAWQLVQAGVATAWPLLLLERPRMGRVSEGIMVSQRVPGQTLANMDLGAMEPARRQTLMRRLGAVLRQIESAGMYLYDAKAHNWIIVDDPARGLAPIVVDVDGLRWMRVPGGGLERLVASLRTRAGFIAADEANVRAGYAPWARTAPARGGKSQAQAAAPASRGEGGSA